MTFTGWDRTEPSRTTTENCSVLYKPGAWTWHDADCGIKFGYICEITI